MSQQTINTGLAPNDGTGDKIRVSFNKVNSNFDELYAKDRDLSNTTNTYSGLVPNVATLRTDVNGITANVSNIYTIVNAMSSFDSTTVNALIVTVNSNYTVTNASFNTTNSVYALANNINTALSDLSNSRNVVLKSSYYTMGSNSRTISYNTSGGLYPPDVTNRIGERIVLWDQSPSYYSYTIGMETNGMWFGVDEGLASEGFRWYKGNTEIMLLDRTANLFINQVNANTVKFADGTIQTVGYTSLVYNTLNAAYTVVNASYTMANANYVVTNAAYNTANVGYSVTNAAFGLTNTTYAAVNSSFGVINSAYTLTNAAFDHANTKSAYTNANVAAYLNDGTAKVVTGNFTVTGMMVLNGNTNFVTSNNTVYTDNLIELHAPGGNVDNAWSYSDGKDIGLRMHYYDASNKHAALVLANDTKYLEWYIEGNENNGVFTGGTYGDIKANNFYGNVKGTANNVLYVGETTAANVISNSSLQYFLGFYASLANLASVNAYSNVVGAASNTWANTVGTSGNTYAMFYTNTTVVNANTYAGVMANASNAWANTISVGANGYAVTVGASGNAYADVVGTSANAYTVVVGASSNAYANVVGASGNAYTNTVTATDRAYTNTSVSAANNYCGSLSNAVNTYSISTYAPIVNPAFTSNVTIYNTLTVNKLVKLPGVEEALSVKTTNTSGIQNFDCSNTYIFYVNNVVGPFTPNLQNFSISSNAATSLTFIIDQGASANITTGNVLIGAANLAINWNNGTPPNGTANKKDIITLSIYNINGSNTVIGQLVSFG